MKKYYVTSLFFAMVMEEMSPAERLSQLNERRRKYMEYLKKAELAALENPSEDNVAAVDNLRECVQDVQEEIDSLVKEL